MNQPNPIFAVPAQNRAFDALISGLQIGSILRLWGGTGRGKTTVLRLVHEKTGGAFLGVKEFIERSMATHPLALEESIYTVIQRALKEHEVVIVDDIHLLDLSSGCHFYPRSGFLNPVLMGLCSEALQANKKLIFGTKAELPDSASQRSYSFGIERFKEED